MQEKNANVVPAAIFGEIAEMQEQVEGKFIHAHEWIDWLVREVKDLRDELDALHGHTPHTAETEPDVAEESHGAAEQYQAEHSQFYWARYSATVTCAICKETIPAWTERLFRRKPATNVCGGCQGWISEESIVRPRKRPRAD
jgi:hypothetical protein